MPDATDVTVVVDADVDDQWFLHGELPEGVYDLARIGLGAYRAVAAFINATPPEADWNQKYYETNQVKVNLDSAEPLRVSDVRKLLSITNGRIDLLEKYDKRVGIRVHWDILDARRFDHLHGPGLSSLIVEIMKDPDDHTNNKYLGQIKRLCLEAARTCGSRTGIADEVRAAIAADKAFVDFSNPR